MKQRAGLGKKVSSIFDGVPLPKVGKEVEQAPPRAEPPIVPPQRSADTAAQPAKTPAVPPQAPTPHRPAEVTSQPVQVPAQQPQTPATHRPAEITSQPRQMPVPPPQAPRPTPAAAPQPQAVPRMVPAQTPQSKTLDQQTTAKSADSASLSVYDISGDSWRRLIHKIFFSANGQADARNKKAVAMVGMLSVVLVVVVMWTGVFSSSQNADAINDGAAAAAASEVRISWTPPEPYPVSFRDPMQLGSVSKTGSGGSYTGSDLIVKSTVVSDNSTALINGEIVHEGQTINGVKVIKINKNSVEFEENGKRSKQQVE